MVLAWISLAALIVVIVASCTTTINPGVLSIVFAWAIGVYLGAMMGKPIGLKAVMDGFPTELFLTLVGITALFAQAQTNGTMERLARVGVRCCQGNAGLMPIMFFGLALGIASIGAGNIASAALVGPLAMAVAGRAGIPAFIMAIMVAHGAVAGALSPFAPTGIIAANLMGRMGLPGHEWSIYLYNLVANLIVASIGYFLFGGWRLLNRKGLEHADSFALEKNTPNDVPMPPLRWRHEITVVVIAALVVGVVGFRIHVGMGAFAAAALLSLLRVADEKETIRAMPWGVILMVCGVTVLTSLLETTGGIDLFSSILARFSTQRSVTGLIAFVTGLVSVYSSTSGVVLPTFLPSVPALIQKLGGGDPLAIASSILIGGHLVDVSPLSTIGALCVAGAAASEDRRRLFNRLLAWGLSMAFVGALFCFVAFGLLGASVGASE
jgi:Na+/H+ antiporter NhaD/arsenite permease-like protein